MRIKERLDEIAAGLGAPPRTVAMTMEEWFQKVEEHFGTRSWSPNEYKLTTEWQELRREYERGEKAKP